MVAATEGDARQPVVSLILLTAVTGFVDAASFLGLEHVFTGNMTGNVLLLGFTLGGAHDVSVSAGLVALAAFLVGATSAGRLLRRPARRTLETVLVFEFVLLLGAEGVAVLTEEQTGIARGALLVLLAMPMGLQSAAARRLAVPNLTTVVITSLLTATAVDSSLAGGRNPHGTRQVAAVLAMLLSAVAGALLLRHGLAWTIGAAVVVHALALAGLMVPSDGRLSSADERRDGTGGQG